MPLDNLDIKIKEAAKNFKPEFGEEAWLKMEELLDVHMPQKDNDRKRIAWLFLLLFTVTAFLLVIIKTWSTERKALSYPKGDIITALTNKIDGASTNLTIKRKLPENNSTSKNTASSINTPAEKPSFSENTFAQNKKIKKIINDHSALNMILQTPAAKGENTVENNVETGKNNQTDQSSKSQDVAQVITKDEKEINKNNSITKNSAPDSSEKHENVTASKTKNNSSKNKNNFRNSFALNFSAGPDISAVDMKNIGKVNPLYGAGIGYAVGKNWTLKAGFYVTRKAYKSEASDYHPPSDFWSYYPKLEYIDADCKVYEVPLIVSYNFGRTSTRAWFVSGGISSYFMKREKYNFFSKDPSVQYLYNSYTISNKNNHYFSSLRLSGGYARKINNTVSVIAEPYLNLPLEGIGYGKVKLYSAGVLFTLSVKPFAKK